MTRPCSLSLSVSLSRLHMLQTWCWLMPVSFCITSSGQSPRLQGTWRQASTLDWPTTLLSKKIILFDRYDQEALSAKDHEWTRRGRAKQVHLTPNTLLPCREVILHNSKNKNLLNNILCSYPLPHNIQLVNMLDCVVTHEETDVTLCSYMLKAVAAGAQTIRILRDDTDVFILLEYWTSRMHVVAKIQMEKWNGDILDINETVQWLGPQKVQSTSRYPCTIRLRYSVIPLWKRKKVSAQAHRDRYTRSRSSARTTWHDPRLARGDSIHILLTPLRTEGMYNNE